jgi:hypothetical protein
MAMFVLHLHHEHTMHQTVHLKKDWDKLFKKKISILETSQIDGKLQ